MRFSKSPHIIFRNYPKFGYLTDNRNFGYDTASGSCKKVGERILSEIGSVFYSILSEKPQTLNEITEKLTLIFPDVPLENLENDAKDFFTELSHDGFIQNCDIQQEAADTKWFSYDNISPHIPSLIDSEAISPLFNEDWFTDYRLTRVHLCVSSACNEYCCHCYFPKHLKREKMSLDLFLKIIDECQSKNVLNLTLSGGEPLLNDNLTFFIQKCRENNFSINLLSNLTLLTGEFIEEFKKTPLLSIQTSLYSMDSDVHDSITGIRGSFNKTKQAIEVLHSLNIPMQINCPIMKLNKNAFHDVLTWAHSLNIEASTDFMLFGCYDGSRENIPYRLELSEIETLINQNLSYSIQEKKQSNTTSICPVCRNSICISPLGKVYPCEGWQSFILGDINNSTLSEIWDDSADIQMLRNLTIKDFPKCQTCHDKDFCSMCLIRNVNESGELDYRDVNPYFCTIAKTKHLVAQNSIKTN